VDSSEVKRMLLTTTAQLAARVMNGGRMIGQGMIEQRRVQLLVCHLLLASGTSTAARWV
jgi:hypothetical protein